MKILCLDVGTKRIGVARADTSVKIAVPVGTIEVDGTELDQIKRFSNIYGTKFIVIGLPRSLKGEETAQSRYTREFAENLKKSLENAEIRFQDESLTSVEAEKRLKEGKRSFKKGEIDTEAATIILQDFLENPNLNSEIEKKESMKTKNNPKKHHSPLIILVIFFVAVFFGALVTFIYNGSLSAVSKTDCSDPSFSENEACIFRDVIISEGMSTSDIANTLKEKNLIQNQFSFQIYAKLNNKSGEMKAGHYRFNQTMSVQKIISKISNGEIVDETFQITTLPGGTLKDFEKTLKEIGYSAEAIKEGFLAVSDHPILSSKPPEASLEGYIYGETIEFENDASVEEITRAFLDELAKDVKENNLEEKFSEKNLTLHEGIILASIIQKEANVPDMKEVASVFYNRLNAGIPLGSDVTASYATDQVDKNRELYTDNGAVLDIDSCYNTRLSTNVGLPCGPISNPGLDALLAVAEPAETSYFYFLTGDDGMMYYGITDSDHQFNIDTYCQESCKTPL